MPRPRFDKLDDTKRDAIFQAAGRHFAEHGYEAGSMNQILADAGISKGSMYYYFDDKADLFATTVEHYAEKILFEMPPLDRDTYWQTFADLYRRPFLRTLGNPWQFGVVKAAGKLPPDSPVLARLAPVYERAFSLMGALIAAGQALGQVRSDLPDDLLYALVAGIDDAGDTWLLAQIDGMSEAQVVASLDPIIDALRRVLAA